MTPVDIPDARPRWSRRRIVAVCCAVVVLAVAITAVARAVREPVCDDQDGLVEVEGQCIGVAAPDRAFDFGQDQLRDVAERIKAQNEIAASDPGHVSIAVLMNLTPPAEHAIEPVTQVKHQLEGAVRALALHNADNTPKVALLPANAGDGFAHWRTAVDELLRRRGAPDRLVAVTGFGQSLTTTQEAIGVLSENQVPMVASTMTSDALRGINGLLRPAPTNSRQAEVAAARAGEILASDAARAGAAPGRSPGVVLITDRNDDDAYSSDLAGEFAEQAGASGIEILKTMTYDSRLKDVKGTFRADQPNICYASTRVFYFAGRGVHLSALVEALGDKPCEKGKELVILTGDDGPTDEQAGTEEFRAGLPGITIVQTDLAAPDLRASHEKLLAKGGDEGRRMSAKAIADFAGRKLPEYALDDAAQRDDGTVLSYDAVLTALGMVTMAVDPARQAPLDHREVLKVVYAVSGKNAVEGASGRLSYTSEGDAEGKVVPLTERTTAGTVLVDVR